jgi:hypothetical protein
MFSVTYHSQQWRGDCSQITESLCGVRVITGYEVITTFKLTPNARWFAAFCLSFCVSTQALAQAPEASGTPTVPVVSGGVAFVPIVQGGQTTLVSIISPVVLVPLGDNWLIESRGAFEGDFTRRDGTGPFGGKIHKQLV